MSETLDDAVHGEFVDIDDERHYRITGYDALEPFLMTLASASDVWCFTSSTGGLTAGRVDADHSLFPYDTDDRIAAAAGRRGGLTLVRPAHEPQRGAVWEPFTGPDCGAPVDRALSKQILGTSIVFEETHHGLGLRIRVAWSASDRFGLVRHVRLRSVTDAPVTVEVLDGVVDLLPPGVSEDMQRRRSNLLNAYKRADLLDDAGLVVLYLNSRLTDLAEPSEALSATVAWQVGLNDPAHLLCDLQVPAFRSGEPVRHEPSMRGERGAHLLASTITLGPGESREWFTVADINYDAADVVDLAALLRDPNQAEVALRDDMRRSEAALTTLLAQADAWQVSGDEYATAHHLANVLFNSMRGGVPVDGYTVNADDVRAFFTRRSPLTASRFHDVLESLPETMAKADLVRLAESSGDPDLQRLAGEYLPLTFSRRHGDPSRPWNKFRISLRDSHGRPRLGFEGNWRDIFQNWEAMASSFPEYIESMITVFVNATTADGYNPYRITENGIDWEVLEPDDPWSNIGYWSDHQIIYLLRLIEASERFHPGRLAGQLDKSLFTHADVPYRIATYAQTLADPYDTVSFDDDRARLIAEREVTEGADARLSHTPDGDLVRVTLTEKLLLLLAAKLVNLVPGGGIWMNTQRPEWNDANNALVGRGLSVVTLAYLRRFIVRLQAMLHRDPVVSTHLAVALGDIYDALAAHAHAVETGLTAAERRDLMDRLGEAGTRMRSSVYAGITGETTRLEGARVASLLDLALRYVEASLRANERGDGLYHSYNLLDIDPDTGEVSVRRLPPMLEGQVAVLSAGMLSASECLHLLKALRASPLYDPVRHSYLLYPDKSLPTFLERNTIPADRAARLPLLGLLVAAGDRRLVVADHTGALHFGPSLRNAKDVRAVLAELGEEPAFASAVAADGPGVLALFEAVFRHAEFTGRAESFFGFEGLGSVYWHMVSKLLLAISEAVHAAVDDDAGHDTVAALVNAYEDVRTGLGYCRTPVQYGAFPTDPYSHTPAGHGARQPGMTGQVKEEVLTRPGELGLRVRDGALHVEDVLLRDAELLQAPLQWRYVGLGGAPRTLDVPERGLAFTVCQVPVRVHRGGPAGVRVHLAKGDPIDFSDSVVPPDLAAHIFARDGEVALVDVTLGG